MVAVILFRGSKHLYQALNGWQDSSRSGLALCFDVPQSILGNDGTYCGPHSPNLLAIHPQPKATPNSSQGCCSNHSRKEILLTHLRISHHHQVEGLD